MPKGSATDATQARLIAQGSVVEYPGVAQEWAATEASCRDRALAEATLGAEAAQVKVTVHEHGSTVVLPCGAVINAVPQDTDEYRATARSLGYGDDTLAMAQDHDRLHVALCEWLGIESASLAVAAGASADSTLAGYEEDAVLAVQRLMRHAGVNVP